MQVADKDWGFAWSDGFLACGHGASKVSSEERIAVVEGWKKKKDRIKCLTSAFVDKGYHRDVSPN